MSYCYFQQIEWVSTGDMIANPACACGQLNRGVNEYSLSPFRGRLVISCRETVLDVPSRVSPGSFSAPRLNHTMEMID